MCVKGWMFLRHACPLLETRVNEAQDGTVRETLFRQRKVSHSQQADFRWEPKSAGQLYVSSWFSDEESESLLCNALYYFFFKKCNFIFAKG